MIKLFLRLLFNVWYYFRPPWDTGVSPPELMDFINSHPPGRALDMGCGTGTNAITLAQHGWQVNGVDFAWRAVRIARRKAQRAGVDVDLRVGDVTGEVGQLGTYDLVLDLGCFHSLTQDGRRAYLRNLERLMASEATYMLYLFLKEARGKRGPGVAEAELSEFPATLQLVERRDSTERGRWPSAWLTFVRK